MDNAGYVLLTRQSGLMDQLDVLATNIANTDTTGYRREATVFSEYIKTTESKLGSVSMATLRTRYADMTQGVLQKTGSKLDVAIEGEGFFRVRTPDGERLTRAGSFTIATDRSLVTLDGHQVLDDGGAAITIPPDAADIKIGIDGTLSAKAGQIGKLALVTVEDTASLRRADSKLLIANTPLRQAEGARVSQGFLESSNVNPLLEITQLIEVQRAYELGQSLIDTEAKRIEQAVRTLGRST
ncbi:MAG: flagellar hook-basal body complex protein [Neomegalonema sp.]|nr:flagellar hook-basal body complex protein [Neomegalonema sp.]